MDQFIYDYEDYFLYDKTIIFFEEKVLTLIRFHIHSATVVWFGGKKRVFFSYYSRNLVFNIK